MKTITERFNDKVAELLPLYWDDMNVPASCDTEFKIEEHMKQHGEFVEGMAFTIMSILENEDA